MIDQPANLQPGSDKKTSIDRLKFLIQQKEELVLWQFSKGNTRDALAIARDIAGQRELVRILQEALDKANS
jgi:hypothetical protein